MANNKQSDPKTEALREQGALNRKPAKITDPLFSQDEFFDPKDLVQVKYEMLRRVRSDGYSVSKASSVFAFSRPSFYQVKSSFERAGLPGLLPKQRGPRRKHKLTSEVLALIQQVPAKEESMRSQALKAALRVKDRLNITLHPRTIERALIGFQKKRRRVSRRNRTPGTRG